MVVPAISSEPVTSLGAADRLGVLPEQHLLHAVAGLGSLGRDGPGAVDALDRTESARGRRVRGRRWSWRRPSQGEPVGRVLADEVDVHEGADDDDEEDEDGDGDQPRAAAAEEVGCGGHPCILPAPPERWLAGRCEVSVAVHRGLTAGSQHPVRHFRGVQPPSSCSSTTRTTCARCSRRPCATPGSTCTPSPPAATPSTRSAPMQPDLIVLDVMLPDLDGFDVCKRLRSSGDRTPVLFLTARDTTEDRVRGLTLGGDDYLVKPFSLEELVARITAVLRRSGIDRDKADLRCARPRDGRRRPPGQPGRRRGGPVARPSTTSCATCS